MNAPDNLPGPGRDSGDALSAPLHAPVQPADGGPLMIDITLIDEDPNQPRSKDNPGFRPESIAELAASFGPKGPKTPLSLRINREAPGRYLINHGARRYRAGKVKGLSALPAFIDNEYEDADQVIENLQREGMTPREMADYIGRELAKGKKKGQIAQRLGKSASFVTQHATLLDLPEPIAAAFNAGRVNDVTVINELVTAYKGDAAEVTAWLSNPNQEITRGEVKLLREYLAAKRRESTISGSSAHSEAAAGEGAAPKTDEPQKSKKPVVSAGDGKGLASPDSKSSNVRPISITTLLVSREALVVRAAQVKHALGSKNTSDSEREVFRKALLDIEAALTELDKAVLEK